MSPSKVCETYRGITDPIVHAIRSWVSLEGANFSHGAKSLIFMPGGASLSAQFEPSTVGLYVASTKTVHRPADATMFISF